MSTVLRKTRRVAGWEWIVRGLIAGLLLTVAACSKTNPPPENPPPNNVEVAANAGPEDLANPDIGLGAELKAATDATRQEIENLEAPAARDESIGAINQTKSRPPAPPLGFGPPGMRGRSGSTKDRLLLVGGGNSVSDLKRPRRAPEPGQGQAGEGKPVALIAQRGFVDTDGAEVHSAENYQPIFDNPFNLVKQDPLSTFSIGVDTASYSNVRRFLMENQLPPKDAVRIAELVNYFPYDYASPKNNEPVAFTLEVGPCPWQPKHHLLRIALKAKTIDKENMPPRNLVFLVDTSGSMQPENRLPLVQKSLRLLVEQLTGKDRVSIVTYAGTAGLLMAPTPGDQKDIILKAIDGLSAGGSTNGAGGIVAAYEQAKLSFIKEGVNRVILATDGDFNVGVSSDAELVRMIEEKRETGVYLTVLGYGMGNLKDSKLEQLAHHGNGHYAYIDTLDEAKKVFVDQGGSLATVAKDVKIQVEFNPAKVAAYRLIGYENRLLRAEDFRNDKKDAGDMGSGHTCTCLYEVVPNGEKVNTSEVEPLKYQTPSKLSDAAKSGEFMTVRMRYKHPDSEKDQEVASALQAKALGEELSKDFQFAAAVAAFGMVLRDSEFKGNANFANIVESAQAMVGEDPQGYRKEFVKLARLALTVEQARTNPAQKTPPGGAGQQQ